MLVTMDRATEIDLDLPRDAGAPAIARRRVRQILQEVVEPKRVSELVVVVSELVSNAVGHGQGAIRMRLRIAGGKATGEVVDDGGGFEHQVRDVGLDELRGRGLLIVEALTARWGVHDGTTHVWFEMDLDERPGERSGPVLGASERPPDLPTAT